MEDQLLKKFPTALLNPFPYFSVYSGMLATSLVNIDWLTVISVFLRPRETAPFLVVINTTPFLPKEPYCVVALKPFSTLMFSMLLGSISKKRLPVWLPYKKLPCVLVEPSNGTPSTTNKG